MNEKTSKKRTNKVEKKLEEIPGFSILQNAVTLYYIAGEEATKVRILELLFNYLASTSKKKK